MPALMLSRIFKFMARTTKNLRFKFSNPKDFSMTLNLYT